MAIAITVPRLGWTMDEGIFERWLKQDGDSVQAGEPLFSLEGEKATQDVEAIDSGVLRIPPDAPKPGDVVPVGHVIAFLLSPGEDPPWETSQRASVHDPSRVGPSRPTEVVAALVAAAPQVQSMASSVPAGSAPASQVGAPTISPRALRVARELGVDWTQIRGTGSSGRIRERDVRANLAKRQYDHGSPDDATADSLPGVRVVPLSPVRKTIAARMRAGLQHAAPVTLTTECVVTNLVQFRRQLLAGDRAESDRASYHATASGTRETSQADVPTYTDLIIKLTATALEQHTMLMAQWTDQGIVIPDGIHINVAVETEVGLVAPLVRDVPSLTLQQLAAATRSLIELAHARRLTAEQLATGTFTISNLGMYGIDAFTPILNAPQSGILGVGRIRRVPAVVGDQIVPRDLMALSLTFDHRVIDGAPAAQFLQTLRRLLEQPSIW
jgi:pyruvate dehydrogenase E2 component (dihydrolipoamide acetyltransferase)